LIVLFSYLAKGALPYRPNSGFALVFLDMLSLKLSRRLILLTK